MENKGYFDPKMDYASKKAATTKSMIKSWTLNNIKLRDKEWSEIDIQEIKQVSTTYSLNAPLLTKCLKSQ